jgi:hypothetical protein
MKPVVLLLILVTDGLVNLRTTDSVFAVGQRGGQSN